jgi:DNA polymerase elongation subunit (family B)
MPIKYTADFETTTDENDCRVWAYGICEIGNIDTFVYGNNIDGFLTFCKNSDNAILYFHNLKFDGEFIMTRLFEIGFRHVTERKELESKTFTTLISDKGQFYSMKIMFEKKGKKTKTVTIYDSLKILPFSVKDIAKGFGLPMSKLEIDYNEKRDIGHILTPLEVDYLRNDVVIVACALNTLFEQGLDKMTQGSNALFDYKRTITAKRFEKYFPTPDYDKDIRRSYRGGFTYLNPKYKDVDINEGIVLDVNSLYPSVMHDRPLPYGEGIFFEGKYKDDYLYNLYVQMFTCQFEIKTNHIPTLQLKNNLAFVPTEYLTSSDDKEVTLCMTSVDLELFLKHYDVYNLEYHSGWKFKSTTGLFTEYIDKWTKVKIESKHSGNKAMYLLSKLMLNALYGKFALNPNVQSKIPYFKDGMIKYMEGEKETRDPIYIPVGTFVTSWARYKTITSAQSVYNRFVYADTDSLHLIGTELPDDLEIDDAELGKWKHESTFTRARFLRQKSYIEEVDGELNITCAGLPESCYNYVTWDNFHEGVIYEGKLQTKRVKGGIVLKDTTFEIKPKKS